MLSLRIIAPETIMVAKTIARMPSTQARIAPQGRLKAKVTDPAKLVSRSRSQSAIPIGSP